MKPLGQQYQDGPRRVCWEIPVQCSRTPNEARLQESGSGTYRVLRARVEPGKDRPSSALAGSPYDLFTKGSGPSTFVEEVAQKWLFN